MSGIKLVISDVDGTLVTNDKRLTDASCRAAATLAARGIGFTVTSSRPPFGLRMLVEPLALKLPIGAFNGGMIVDPAMAIVEQHLIPQAAAKRCLDVLSQFDVEPWLFTKDKWTVRNGALSYVARKKPSQSFVHLCNRNASRGGGRVDWVGYENCIRNPRLKRRSR